MANTNYLSVDDYVAAQPSALTPILERVRATLRKALHDADEVISYQIPAYRLAGGMVIFFAGWKSHYSVYPATAGVVEGLRAELEGYAMSKGTIRFPLTQPVPVRLLTRIAKIRAKEVVERAQAKTKAKAKQTKVKPKTKRTPKAKVKPQTKPTPKAKAKAKPKARARRSKQSSK